MSAERPQGEGLAYRVKSVYGDLSIGGSPLLSRADLIALVRRTYSPLGDDPVVLRDQDGATVEGEGVLAWGAYYLTHAEAVDA